MNECTIRPAEPADAAGIGEIMREVQWLRAANETLGELTERITKRLEWNAFANTSSTTLVAVDEDNVVLGFSSTHWIFSVAANEGYISHLYVRSSARDQGVGGDLLDAIVSEARQRRCFRLLLYAREFREVYQREFYPKHGWEEQKDAALFMLRVEPVQDA